jgi:hypothetical protein
MKLISHRGNLKGKVDSLEKSPSHIIDVLNSKIDCEIDVWFVDNQYYLGHDNPQYRIDESFLSQNGLWCHAKNLESLEKMLEIRCHCFWHENDDFTLTSQNYIWTFPEKKVGKKSIIVDNNEDWQHNNYECFGVCSDWIL